MATPTIHFAGPDAQILVLACAQQLTGSAADQLVVAVSRHLPERQDAGVVLDFSDTAMIGSVGIAAMLQVRELCQRRDAPLVLAALSGTLLDFLTMLRLAQHFTIEPGLDAAIARAARNTDPH